MRTRDFLRLIALGSIALVGSFVLGVKTAGEVQPFGQSKAEAPAIEGDVDGDGNLTVEDAYLALTFAAGREQPATWQLRTVRDGTFTTDTVLKILRTLSPHT